MGVPASAFSGQVEASHNFPSFHIPPSIIVHPFTSFTLASKRPNRWRPSRAGSQAPSGGPLFSWHQCSLKSIPSGLKSGHWVLAAVKSRTTWISGKRCMEKYRKWYKVVSKAVRSLFFYVWFLMISDLLLPLGMKRVSPCFTMFHPGRHLTGGLCRLWAIKVRHAAQYWPRNQKQSIV
jgi:hypothetical protein